MKNRFVYLFSQLALFGGFCFFSLAEVQNPHEKHLSNNNLKNEIHRILKTSSVPLKNFGLVVSPVLPSDEEFYFSHNENKLFIPASLSKIVVASAVLHYFSPFHQFETLFLSDSFVKNGQLSGSLYMKGGGDPSFVSESLWILVNTLRRLGLKKVDGDLVLDHFLFNRSSRKNKWFGDVDRSFNTPLSALSFNWNSVAVRIRPGLKENDPAYVFSDLENSYIQLSNKTKTKGLKKNIHFSRKKRSSSKGDHILVQGSVPLNEPEFVVYRNVSDPVFWVGSNVIEFLKQRGIQIQGQIKTGRTPKGALVLSNYRGRNIFQLVQDMMKYSNNLIADNLTAHLSVQNKEDSNGSIKKGVLWIHKYLKKSGIKNYTFVQPSGLSRKNKLTPRGILYILSQDINSLYSFEKVSSYPLGGGDGSLKNRFKNLKNPSLVRAKTGWLSGVVGLGGYVKNQQGRTRAFVFLYNGSAKRQFEAQALMDQLAEALTRY